MFHITVRPLGNTYMYIGYYAHELINSLQNMPYKNIHAMRSVENFKSTSISSDCLLTCRKTQALRVWLHIFTK